MIKSDLSVDSLEYSLLDPVPIEQYNVDDLNKPTQQDSSNELLKKETLSDLVQSKPFIEDLLIKQPNEYDIISDVIEEKLVEQGEYKNQGDLAQYIFKLYQTMDDDSKEALSNYQKGYLPENVKLVLWYDSNKDVLGFTTLTKDDNEVFIPMQVGGKTNASIHGVYMWEVIEHENGHNNPNRYAPFGLEEMSLRSHLNQPQPTYQEGIQNMLDNSPFSLNNNYCGKCS